MTKRLATALILVIFGASLAAAAAAKLVPVTGTVASIKGMRVEITVEGEKADWVKRGSGIKIKGGLGKIVDISATTITFNTKKAGELKVGEKVTIEKSKTVPAGC